MFVFEDRELIHPESVVVVRLFQIDEESLGAANGSVGSILDSDAVYQQPMKRSIPRIERRAFKAVDFAQGVIDRFGGQSRI